MNLRKQPIYLSGKQGPGRQNSAANMGTIFVIALAVFANYVVFMQDSTPTEEATVQQEAPVTPVPAAPKPDLPAVEESPTPEVPFEDEGGTVLAGNLKKGESILSSLEKLGMPSQAARPVVLAMESVFDFRKARVGDEYELSINAKGEVSGFTYSTSPLDKYRVSLDGEEFVAVKRDVPVNMEIVELGCRVKSSLYATIKRCGEDAQLGTKLVDLLAWDLDFFEDVRNGDEIRLLLEKKSVEGRFLAYGNILGGEYRGKFKTYRFFWYENEKNNVAAYFTEKGDGVKKEFLKTPLKYTRISSGYSHNRFHPVLHKWKKHLGIDYAAPTGAPVWSVASGKVIHVGYKGANGNLVTVRHDNGFTSYYAHLSRYARNLKEGDTVEQKQIIGFVGATGRATGPHLHFGLKHKGKFVNPQKVKYTMGPSVPANCRVEFNAQSKERIEKLRAISVGRIDKRS